jgi:8-oxo-dGTP pyrophosphatase MutT (NUDIX family)
MADAAFPELKARIAANLAAFPRRALPEAGLKAAAVAIVVGPWRGEPAFLLTRRALTLRRNAGNYALPGGHLDPGEDAAQAARRETAEELGVSLGPDAVLGLLDDFVTLTGRVVTPVALWSDAELHVTPDPAEVHEAWRIPLSQLDHPDSPRRRAHTGAEFPILQMRLRNSWVNAPTAAWIWQFREAALHGRVVRLDEVGQPAFTAR